MDLEVLTEVVEDSENMTGKYGNKNKTSNTFCVQLPEWQKSSVNKADETADTHIVEYNDEILIDEVDEV